MAISDQDYIAELEAALIDRDAQIAALLAKYEPPPPVAKINGPFVMPNDGQLHNLLSIVTRAYPVLARARADDAALFEEFTASLRYLATVHRCDELDTTYATSVWTGRAREHAHRPIALPSFAAAVIAANDIDYVAPREERTEWYFGLMIGSRAGSRPASNQWLSLLKGGPVRQPVVLPRIRAYGEGGRVSVRP